MLPKNHVKKAKHKQGIKAKIEAFEQLKGLEARKLDFNASSTSTTNSKEIVFSQSGRGGGTNPPIGESLNFPLRITPF